MVQAWSLPVPDSTKITPEWPNTVSRFDWLTRGPPPPSPLSHHDCTSFQPPPPNIESCKQIGQWCRVEGNADQVLGFHKIQITCQAVGTPVRPKNSDLLSPKLVYTYCTPRFIHIIVEYHLIIFFLIGKSLREFFSFRDRFCFYLFVINAVAVYYLNVLRRTSLQRTLQIKSWELFGW